MVGRRNTNRTIQDTIALQYWIGGASRLLKKQLIYTRKTVYMTQITKIYLTKPIYKGNSHLATFRYTPIEVYALVS